MGRALVVANLGEGLYRVQLLYGTKALDRERDRLQADADKAAIAIAEARKTVAAIAKRVEEARGGMDAVIAQWRAGVIRAGEQGADPIPGDDGAPAPSTELVDSLASAIGAIRSASSVGSVARNATLDLAADWVLSAIRNEGATRDWATPEMRATGSGYAYAAAVGVGEGIALGRLSGALAAAAMDQETLAGAGYTELGVAYLYDKHSTYTHLWCALLSAPGPVNTVEFPPDDPAKSEAEKSDAALSKIEAPKTDAMEPAAMQAACVRFATEKAALAAGEKALAKLIAEDAERRRQIAELTAAKAAPDVVIECWCAQYIDDIPLAATVPTAEVPGYYDPSATQRSHTMETGAIVLYVERGLNIVNDSLSLGQLQRVEGLSDAGWFVNTALEPGHLRWKPFYRYGQIIGIDGYTYTVAVNSETERALDYTEALAIDAPDDAEIVVVGIRYPCPELFELYDEVLIEYDNRDRTMPAIIGWRREPVECTTRRISWRGG